jgi:hypothetical protein
MTESIRALGPMRFGERIESVTGDITTAPSEAMSGAPAV